ncbi:MAG: hypothetical protein JXL84_23745 [Deltaproteobacteria bacterium]|nr:hypothetical protein [Deltaproteobacteria bacterium]
MAKPLKEKEIVENLKLLSDWLRVKYPGEHFELVVAGGAAMTLEGFKGQTTDIDLLRPKVLPDSLKKGIAQVSRARKLGAEWLNTGLAKMLLKAAGSVTLPRYFDEVSRTLKVSDNLRIGLIGRQALISLKMYATTPSYRKHTEDLSNLKPNRDEIAEALRFVMSIDDSDPRKDDLRIVMKELGFDFDEIHRNLTKKGKSGR